MNSLSWLLYLINLVNNFASYFLFVTIVSFVALAVVIFIVHVSAACRNSDTESYLSYKNRPIISHIERNKVYRNYIWIPFVMGLICSFIPNSRTMYLIAASEIGERVVTNERVAGLIDPTIDILKNYVTLENKKIQEELAKIGEKKK